MSKMNFTYATLVRYNGQAMVLGSEVESGVRWARFVHTRSWIRVKSSEVEAF